MNRQQHIQNKDKHRYICDRSERKTRWESEKNAKRASRIRRENETAKNSYEVQKKKNADDENQQRREKKIYTTFIYQESHAKTDHNEEKEERRAFNATFTQRRSEAANKFQRNQNTYEKKFDVDEWHNFVDDDDEKNIRRVNAWCTFEQREHIQLKNDDWKNRQTKQHIA